MSNRNTEQHFANTPVINIGRSKFDRPFNLKTSFSTGDIVPIFCDQVVPGDSIKMRMSNVVRMMTPLVPVLDNCYMDTYFFFVPWRLVWEHTKQFVGENDTSPWAQQVEYEIPQIEAPQEGWDVKSLAVYLGEPAGVPKLRTSALKFRAYSLIYNEWFRSEVVTTPVYIHKDDALTHGMNYEEENYNPVTDTEKGCKLLKACKPFDYFTGGLPSAQKGEAVMIPLANEYPNVKWELDYHDHTNKDVLIKQENVTYKNATDNVITTGMAKAGFNSEDEYEYTSLQNITGSFRNPTMAKMYVDLTQATGATVTALRQAFAVQKFYEKAGLMGSRMGEVIKGHFGVTNPDYRNMIPEYLGGFRTPITINQVIQTSATDNTSPQGNTAGYSVTVDRKDYLFDKSFTEWGIVMGLAVVRTDHSYQQGQNREWAKKKKFDFYWPEFANLSNQAILNKEIYAQGPNVVDINSGVAEDEKAFAYQEAWAEMRYAQDIITGELRSDYSQPLDMWHYADYYQELPTLSTAWLQETEMNVARTLAVQNHDQFFGDFFFGTEWTRPMPVYSIPGLIDHH